MTWEEKPNYEPALGGQFLLLLSRKGYSLRSPENAEDESKSRYKRFHEFENLRQESKTKEEHAEIEDQ